MTKAANLLAYALNASLFPVRFSVELATTDDGIRATVTGSQAFDPQDIERALFGKREAVQDTNLF